MAENIQLERVKLKTLNEKAQLIVKTAEAEKRQITDDELAEVNKLTAMFDVQKRKVQAMECIDPMDTYVNSVKPRVTTPEWPGGGGRPRSNEPGKIQTWSDGRGRSSYVFDASHKISDHIAGGSGAFGGTSTKDYSMGRFIRASITGDWRQAAPEREFMASLSGSSNPAGGTLVPELISSELIDLARAKSAMIAAGMRTMPMESSDFVIATVTADPTAYTRGEGMPITESEPTFGSVALRAQTIGVLVRASKELAMDAPNFDSLITEIIGGAFAAELDRLCLYGSGSDGLTGLLTQTGITETGSVGGITYQDLMGANTAIQLANGTCTACIINPDIAGDLDLIQESTAGGWLGMPPSLANLKMLPTSNCLYSSMFLGGFENVILGLRLAPQIQFSDVAGTAFQNNEVLIRLVWRGAMVVTRPTQLHRLTGITT